MMSKMGLCFKTPPPAMRNMALAVMLMGTSSLASAQDKADVVLYNDQLITMDEQQPNAQALAVKGNTLLLSEIMKRLKNGQGRIREKLILRVKR